MSILDKVKKMVSGKTPQIEKAVDKAVGTIDDKTKGKYSDKLTKGAEKAKEGVRSLDAR